MTKRGPAIAALAAAVVIAGILAYAWVSVPAVRKQAPEEIVLLAYEFTPELLNVTLRNAGARPVDLEGAALDGVELSWPEGADLTLGINEARTYIFRVYPAAIVGHTYTLTITTGAGGRFNFLVVARMPPYRLVLLSYNFVIYERFSEIFVNLRNEGTEDLTIVGVAIDGREWALEEARWIRVPAGGLAADLIRIGEPFTPGTRYTLTFITREGPRFSFTVVGRRVQPGVD